MEMFVELGEIALPVGLAKLLKLARRKVSELVSHRHQAYERTKTEALTYPLVLMVLAHKVQRMALQAQLPDWVVRGRDNRFMAQNRFLSVRTRRNW